MTSTPASPTPASRAAIQARAGRMLPTCDCSRRRAAGLGLVTVLVVGGLLWVDPLGDVVGELGAMNPVWLAAAVGLEIASCVSYVVVFRRLFDPTRGRSAAKPAWVGLGAGALLPGGNVAGAAVSGVLLHRDGVPKRRLLERASTLLVLINAASVAAVGIAGALLLSGGVTGPHDFLRAGLPILVSVAITGSVAAIPFVVRRAGDRAPTWIVQLAEGVSGTGRVLRRPNWRALGAVGYPIFDMAALWAACAATGHAPGFAALIVAYNVGYLTSIVPIPAGVGVLDGGLAAALIFYGASPPAALAAVLVYHALAVWVPALGGLGAWALLRREQRAAALPAAAVVRSSDLRNAARLQGQLA
jgi:uncharacterized membrane protein YbhN (UPF0104 family)